MNKKTIQSVLFWGLLSCGTLHAENYAKNIIKNPTSSIPTYLEFNSQAQPETSQILTWMKEKLSLSNSFGLRLLNQTTDDLGITHSRYQQTLNGYPVEESMYIIHSINGKVISMNGDLESSLGSSKSAAGNSFLSLSSSAALSKAKTHFNAKKYMPSADQHFHGDEEAPAQVYVQLKQEDGSIASVLCYRFNLYALEPLKRSHIYINASTGDVVLERNLLHHSQAAGQTYFNGQQNFETDSTATGFRLYDTSRGNGIHTYDAQASTAQQNVPCATEFLDADNDWAGTASSSGALDGHWGSSKTHDYFLNKHSRNGIDNAGYSLKVCANWGAANGIWDGQKIILGKFGVMPMAWVGIVAHEITHGLTTNTANLIYQGESGALNESFSDIFGKAVSKYAEPAAFNWAIGKNTLIVRNMQTPNSKGDPDTYGGTNWKDPTNIFDGDQGGVHSNSGVQNHWFYLLVEGGSANNDNGQAYNVTGIGMDKAAAIAFRNLTVYLTNSSNYANARTFSVQSAIDLYGACSEEVKSTENAWHAVGVGAATTCGAATSSSGNSSSLASSSTVSSSSSTPQSSAQVSSSQVASSSSATGIDCSSFPEWQNRSYDWVATKEFVKYQNNAYSHTSWVNNTAPNLNTDWNLEGACIVIATSSSSNLSSSLAGSSSTPLSSSVALSSSSVIATSSQAQSSITQISSSSQANASSSDQTVSSIAVNSSSSETTTLLENNINVAKTGINQWKVSNIESAQVFDSNGSLLNISLEQKIIDLNSFPQGIYFLRVLNGQQLKIQQLIVVK